MNKARCFAATVLATVAAFATCSAAARFYATEIRFNFGLAVEGDVVTHAFSFRNLGDTPLSVLDVITECGCTVGEVSANPIEPGATGELVVFFHTTGYQDKSVLKSVTLMIDDPAVPTATFELAGWVIRRDAVLLDPADLEGRLLLVIDLRDWDAYAAGHLLGAVSLLAADAATWLEQLPSDAAVLLYDQDGVVSAQLAARWVVAGHTGVRSLAGGLDEWVRQFGERWISAALPFVIAPGAVP